MPIRELLTFWIFHWCPEKAICIGDHTLLWDARCAGIYAGFGAAVAWALLRSRVGSRLPATRLLLAVTALFLPFALDVLTLSLKMRAPSNEIRFLTGILFGAAFTCYVFPSSVAVLFPGRTTPPPIINSIGEYGSFILIFIAVYSAKALAHEAVFQIMNALTIFGFVALVSMLAASLFVLTLRTCKRLLRAIQQRFRDRGAEFG